MHSTGQTWSHRCQFTSLTQNITGNITDINNPFAFFCLSKHLLRILRYPITSFLPNWGHLFVSRTQNYYSISLVCGWIGTLQNEAKGKREICSWQAGPRRKGKSNKVTRDQNKRVPSITKFFYSCAVSYRCRGPRTGLPWALSGTSWGTWNTTTWSPS